MCMHIAEKLGVEGAKKHGLTDRMEFRKKSNEGDERLDLFLIKIWSILPAPFYNPWKMFFLDKGACMFN